MPASPRSSTGGPSAADARRAAVDPFARPPGTGRLNPRRVVLLVAMVLVLAATVVVVSVAVR